MGFAEIADMRLELRTLIASVATQVESPGSEPIHDSDQQRYSERIDGARDLIQQGLVVAARAQLERIQHEAEELPDILRFRLVRSGSLPLWAKITSMKQSPS